MEDNNEVIDYKAKYEELLSNQAKIKDAMDKACSDAAAYKKQLREKQSEQERIDSERAESEALMRAELEGYRTANRISNYANKLIEAGYDVQTANTMAKSLPDGIGNDFFESQKNFLEGQKKSMESQIVKTMPGITIGEAPKSADKDVEDYKRIRSYFG